MHETVPACILAYKTIFIAVFQLGAVPVLTLVSLLVTLSVKSGQQHLALVALMEKVAERHLVFMILCGRVRK